MISLLLDIGEKVLWAVVCAIAGYFATKYKSAKKRKQEEEQDLILIKTALKHTLRGIIRDDYNEFMARGYITFEESQEFDKTYKTYVALNGNGVVEHMHEEILSLPIK